MWLSQALARANIVIITLFLTFVAVNRTIFYAPHNMPVENYYFKCSYYTVNTAKPNEQTQIWFTLVVIVGVQGLSLEVHPVSSVVFF